MTKETCCNALTVTTGIFGLLGGLGVLPAVFAPMIGDAPGSLDQWYTVLLIYCVMGFPVMCLGTVVLSWLAYALRCYRTAVLIAWLPALVIIAGGIALYVLNHYHGGRFAG